MLRLRLAAAAAIIVPLLLLIWLDDQAARPGIWRGPLAAILSVLAALELHQLLRHGGHVEGRGGWEAIATLGVTGAALMPLAWSTYPADCPLGKPGWAWLGMALAMAVLLTREVAQYGNQPRPLIRLAFACLIVAYSGLLLSFLIQLRFLQPPRLGLLAVVGTIVIVKLSDTGAYFVGKSCGRHKLAPRLSPGKTIEGAVGGLTTAAVAAIVLGQGLVPWAAEGLQPAAWWIFGLYGLTIGAAGILGDLSESFVKREVQQKDSARWLPGLGGVLDILDSLLGAAPVSFVWWVSGILTLSENSVPLGG